jgi:predicted permease
LSNPLTDLRYTLRQLRRSPGFAVTAVLTLALGIGATTAIYSIVRSTLLAPLPYPHSEELVGLGFMQPGQPPSNPETGEASDLIEAQAKSFASIGVADGGPLGANFSSGSGAAQSIHSLRVSSTYLPTLGVAPILGHTFTRDEDLPHAPPTVLLSENLWRRSLNVDPNIVGKVVHINEDSYTVIGVMPSRFATVDSPDVWQPLHLSADDPGYDGTNFAMIARLKPGVSLQQASAEMNTLNVALYRKFPNFAKWNDPGTPLYQQYVWPLHDIVVSNARPSLLALSAAVLAVLLLACLNLAGLMTARSIGRRSEIALRTALGASRTTMLRLLLTESLLLAIAGSLLGLALATFLVPVMVVSSPIDTTQIHAPAIDFSAAVFAVLTGCATTLIFGLIPALTVFRQSVGTHIGNIRSAGETAPQQRLSKSLIVAQVALATTMLSAGAMLLSAFLNMRAIPSGIRPQHLYALQVNLKGDAYSSAVHTQQFISAVEDRLRQIPGVARVATVNGLPLDGGLNASAGPIDHKELIHNSEIRFISPDYFSTAGLPLLAGNDISTADSATAPKVALINDMAAKRWFPGRNPIGEFIVAMGGDPLRVIGVTANSHNMFLADNVRPTAYVPLAQIPDDAMKTINGWFSTTFLLRTIERSGSPDPDLAHAAWAAVAAVDPEVPAAKFVPMQSFVDKSIAAPRFFSWIAGGFAVFALLLTVVGLFGLLSYQVTSRTRELGVRMALGAQRHQILTLVLNNGLILTAIGLALGVLGSFALRNVIASFLYATVDGLGRDTATSLLGSRILAIAIAAIAMLLATIAASLIPAERAAHLEPTEALRAE